MRFKLNGKADTVSPPRAGEESRPKASNALQFIATSTNHSLRRYAKPSLSGDAGAAKPPSEKAAAAQDSLARNRDARRVEEPNSNEGQAQRVSFEQRVPDQEAQQKESADALRQRVKDALRKDDTETATRLGRQAIEAAPEREDVPLQLAVAALGEGHPEVASTWLSEVQPRFPSSARVQRVLGTAYYRSGDYEAAREALQRSISLDNTSGLSYFLLGSTLRKLDQTDEAEDYLLEASRLDPRFAKRP